MWYGFTTAWHVSRTACLKAGGGSFGQLERCSSECQSVAQTDQDERSTRLGWTGMFRWYVLLGQQGKKHVSGVAGLKPWSARAWRRRASARAFARARVRALLRPTEARAVRRQLDNMAAAVQSSAADRKHGNRQPLTRPVLWGMFGGLECASWLGLRRTLTVNHRLVTKPQ